MCHISIHFQNFEGKNINYVLEVQILIFREWICRRIYIYCNRLDFLGGENSMMDDGLILINISAPADTCRTCSLSSPSCSGKEVQDMMASVASHFLHLSNGKRICDYCCRGCWYTLDLCSDGTWPINYNLPKIMRTTLQVKRRYKESTYYFWNNESLQSKLFEKLFSIYLHVKLYKIAISHNHIMKII